MTNHFTLKKAAYQNPQPLCPWQVASDKDKYADVDGTGEAFAAFMKDTQKRPHAVNGSFHLALGPEGCGKTSLLNRCVEFFNQTHSPLKIIDISREGSPSIAAAQKGATAWDLIIDEIKGDDKAFTQAEIEKITNRDLSLRAGVRELSRLLQSKDTCLAIIVPAIELQQEFDSYFELKRDGIALFSETTNTDLYMYCRRQLGPQSNNPVQLMKLSPIEPSDAPKFVANRLAKKSDKCPDISADALSRYMRVRFEGGMGANIKELQLVCESAYQFAIENGKAEVEFEDFARHYVANGEIG